MRRVATSKVTKPKGARAASPKGGTSLDVGRRVLGIEARAVQALVQRLDGGFSEAVDLLYHCKGKVVVSGMGKSGLIGQKIAATMASTGTPSFFLHPAEGLHGDLGMLARRDVLIAISNSGETQEILQLLPFMERMGIPVVAIVGRMGSTLAKNSAVALDVSVAEEACPMGLAPTASTTATLAMGDALAVALRIAVRTWEDSMFRNLSPAALGITGRQSELIELALTYGFRPDGKGNMLAATMVTSFLELDSRVLHGLGKVGGPLVQAKADREGRTLLKVFARVSRAIEANPVDAYQRVSARPDVPKPELEEFRRLLRLP